MGNAKSVTASGFAISGSASGKYLLTQPTGLTANITPASLTISSVTANNKAYDRSTSATLNYGSVALSGVISADSANVSFDTTNAAGQFANPNVGNSKPVTASGFALSGSESGNYLLTQPNYITANITPVTISVNNLAANNKVFDGTTTATINSSQYDFTGVLSGDASSVTINTASVTANFDDKNVGNAKPVTASGFLLSGAAGGNYLLTQPTGFSANITPEEKPIVSSPISDPKQVASITQIAVKTVSAAFTNVMQSVASKFSPSFKQDTNNNSLDLNIKNDIKPSAVSSNSSFDLNIKNDAKSSTVSQSSTSSPSSNSKPSSGSNNASDSSPKNDSKPSSGSQKSSNSNPKNEKKSSNKEKNKNEDDDAEN